MPLFEICCFMFITSLSVPPSLHSYRLFLASSVLTCSSDVIFLSDPQQLPNSERFPDFWVECNIHTDEELSFLLLVVVHCLEIFTGHQLVFFCLLPKSALSLKSVISVE